MREEKDFDDHQRHSQNKKGYDFPTGKAREVMPKEKKGKANRGYDSRHRCPRNFEFEPGADNATEQKQWCQSRDPKRELLETSRSERNDATFDSRLLH